MSEPREQRSHRPSFLLIGDEWSPTRGGISTFNRSMATALAAAGHPTVCLVASATRREHEDARARGVTLVTAVRTPAGPNLYIPAPAALRAAPNIVVGHDRVSGSIAWTYVRRYVRKAALAFIVHAAAPETEPYKGRRGAQHRIETRERTIRRIARDAAVVAAAGPRLTRYAEGVVSDGFGGVPVLQLDPGMDVPDGISDHRRVVPRNRTILLLGRAEDVELKGLDIVAKATAGLNITERQLNPTLLIRGAPAEDCDHLHGQLVGLSGLARDRIDVRSFTSDLDQIGHDLRRAVLCVMPSRAEGFGLAALEAIGLGTPVLVSDKSGLAETLRDRLGRFAQRMIVEIVDDIERDAARWTSAVQQVLDDPDDAFAYAHEVRSRLTGSLRWDAMVGTLVARLESLPSSPMARR